MPTAVSEQRGAEKWRVAVSRHADSMSYRVPWNRTALCQHDLGPVTVGTAISLKMGKIRCIGSITCWLGSCIAEEAPACARPPPLA